MIAPDGPGYTEIRKAPEVYPSLAEVTATLEKRIEQLERELKWMQDRYEKYSGR